MRIKIKRLPHCFALPEYKSLGAVGADLYAAEDSVFVGMGDFILPGKLQPLPEKIKTGVCIELPAGYYAQVVGRSGLSASGIAVISGTIDQDYRGEISVLTMYCGTKNRVRRGDRIAQLVISPVVQAVFVESEELSETERGEKGFGSSGV